MKKISGYFLAAVTSVTLALGLTAPALAGTSTGTPTGDYFSSTSGILSTVGPRQWPGYLDGVYPTTPPVAGNLVTIQVSSCTGFNLDNKVEPTRTSTVTSTGSWGDFGTIGVPLFSLDSDGYLVRPNSSYGWKLTETTPDGTMVHESTGVYDFATLDGWADGGPCPTTGDQLCNLYQGDSSIDCDPARFGLSPVTPGGGTTTPPTTGGGTTTTTVIPLNHIYKWSVKKGGKYKKYAKIGKYVAVTLTYLTTAGKNANAKVTYYWKVNRTIVSHNRSLKIKKAWRGKTVTMIVKVSEPGKTSRHKTISYGKARR